MAPYPPVISTETTPILASTTPSDSSMTIAEIDEVYWKYMFLGFFITIPIAIYAYIPLYRSFLKAQLLRQILIVLATLTILAKIVEAIMPVFMLRRRIADVSGMVSTVTLDAFMGLLLNLIASALTINKTRVITVLLRFSIIETVVAVIVVFICQLLDLQVVSASILMADSIIILGLHFYSLWIIRRANGRGRVRSIVVVFIERVTVLLTIIMILLTARMATWLVGMLETPPPDENDPDKYNRLEASMPLYKRAERLSIAAYAGNLAMIYLILASAIFHTRRIQTLFSRGNGFDRPKTSGSDGQSKKTLQRNPGNSKSDASDGAIPGATIAAFFAAFTHGGTNDETTDDAISQGTLHSESTQSTSKLKSQPRRIKTRQMHRNAMDIPLAESSGGQTPLLIPSSSSGGNFHWPTPVTPTGMPLIRTDLTSPPVTPPRPVSRQQSISTTTTTAQRRTSIVNNAPLAQKKMVLDTTLQGKHFSRYLP